MASGEPASCLKIVQICVIVYVHSNAYICAKELFSPHSVNTRPLAPPLSGTEPLPTRVIAKQHSPAIPTTKPLYQILSAWKTIPRISRWLLCIRAGVRPSTTRFQWHGAVSNIASKCTDPKTRAMRIVRKRSDRTSPSKQAGVQLFQPLFCGAQERWRALPDTTSQAHQQSALQASVRDNFAGTARADIALASSQAVCFSSDQDIATGVMQDQGGASFSDTHHPEPAEPALVPRPDRTAGGTALADHHKEGFAIPGGRLGVAPEPGVVEPSCAADIRGAERPALHSRVLDTLSEVRAPSTRCLYALKWGVFVKLCGETHIDPAICNVSDACRSFLQYMLDSGSLPSTQSVCGSYCLVSFPAGQAINR